MQARNHWRACSDNGVVRNVQHNRLRVWVSLWSLAESADMVTLKVGSYL